MTVRSAFIPKLSYPYYEEIAVEWLSAQTDNTGTSFCDHVLNSDIISFSLISDDGTSKTYYSYWTTADNNTREVLSL